MLEFGRYLNLSWITVVVGICGVAFSIASLIPGWRDEASDRTIPHGELWSRWDGGPAIFLTGCFLMLVAILIYRGWPVMRHLIAMFVIGVGLSGFFEPEYHDLPWPLVSIIALVAIFWAIRFSYFRADVAEYFAGRTKSE